MNFFAIIVAIVFLDQGTKYMVQNGMALGESWPVVENIFHITYSKNPGAAFGILAYQTTFFVIVTIILLVIIMFLFIKLDARFYQVKIALALQFGGAVGNLIDRVRIGYVTDFIDFQFWPILNVADTAIVIGVGLLVLWLLFPPKHIQYLFKE